MPAIIGKMPIKNPIACTIGFEIFAKNLKPKKKVGTITANPTNVVRIGFLYCERALFINFGNRDVVTSQ